LNHHGRIGVKLDLQSVDYGNVSEHEWLRRREGFRLYARQPEQKEQQQICQRERFFHREEMMIPVIN